jgi:hypothetical protein
MDLCERHKQRKIKNAAKAAPTKLKMPALFLGFIISATGTIPQENLQAVAR